MTSDTISEALKRVRDNSFPAGVNAVIFLLHKPIGLGTSEKIVRMQNSEFWELVDEINSSRTSYKIGFDSCAVPALIQHSGQIDMNCLDTCEGGRWSAYITPDMKMLPCSFDNQEQKWAVDLQHFTIKEAWDSRQFEDFRSYFRSACPECGDRERCMGGCPICREIVLCNRTKKWFSYDLGLF